MTLLIKAYVIDELAKFASAQSISDFKMGDLISADRKFFVLKPAYISYLDTYEVQNEQKLLINLPKDSPKMFVRQRHRRGFWPMPERPRIVIGAGCKIVSREFDLMKAFWIVSERCKDVMLSADGAGFEFLACDCYDKKGKMLDTRWLCDVTRSLDILDKLDIPFGAVQEVRGAKGLILDASWNLIIRYSDIPSDVHIFGMSKFTSEIVVDEHFRNTMKAAGIKNMQFKELSMIK